MHWSGGRLFPAWGGPGAPGPVPGRAHQRLPGRYGSLINRLPLAVGDRGRTSRAIPGRGGTRFAEERSWLAARRDQREAEQLGRAIGCPTRGGFAIGCCLGWAASGSFPDPRDEWAARRRRHRPRRIVPGVAAWALAACGAIGVVESAGPAADAGCRRKRLGASTSGSGLRRGAGGAGRTGITARTNRRATPASRQYEAEG